MAAHRYWRVRVTANNGDTYARIGELRMATQAGGANVLAGGAPIFTNQFSGAGDNSAAAAFDGNAATAWAGAMGPVALGYALAAGNPLDIQEVTIVCRNDGFGPAGAPKDFTIQWSDDNVAFTDAWAITGQVGWAAGATRTFARPTPAQPTLTATPGNANVRLDGNAYVGGAGDGSGHGASQWQITLATDPTFAAPVYDSGFSIANKLTITVGALPLGVNLIARVRYQSAAEGVSPWSAATASFVVIAFGWTQTDLGPDVAGTETVTAFIGIGPLNGVPRSNAANTVGPHGVIDGIDISYDRVTVNPAGLVGMAIETIQHDAGTGFPAADPLTLTFTPPIRGFKATAKQVDYSTGKMIAKNAAGVELDRKVFFPAVGQGFSVDVTVEIQRAAAEIKTIELYPDQIDWAVFADFYMTYDHPSTGGWSETDTDPAIGAWNATDAAPATVWS